MKWCEHKETKREYMIKDAKISKNALKIIMPVQCKQCLKIGVAQYGLDLINWHTGYTKKLGYNSLNKKDFRDSRIVRK